VFSLTTTMSTLDGISIFADTYSGMYSKRLIIEEHGTHGNDRPDVGIEIEFLPQSHDRRRIASDFS